jgi:hypothetical protein
MPLLRSFGNRLISVFGAIDVPLLRSFVSEQGGLLPIEKTRPYGARKRHEQPSIQKLRRSDTSLAIRQSCPPKAP